MLSPSPPSSVDCVELKLECTTSTLQRGGTGEERCLNLTSYCVSVPRVLTRVVGVVIFDNLSWDNQDCEVCSKSNRMIGFRSDVTPGVLRTCL